MRIQNTALLPFRILNLNMSLKIYVFFRCSSVTKFLFITFSFNRKIIKHFSFHHNREISCGCIIIRIYKLGFWKLQESQLIVDDYNNEFFLLNYALSLLSPDWLLSASSASATAEPALHFHSIGQHDCFPLLVV